MLFKKRCEVYAFTEFRKELDKKDIALVERLIEHIKDNKVMYARLVLLVALILHYNSFVYASEVARNLDSVGTQIMSMLMSFAKWGCIGMGTKSMIVTLINGGNMKQAMTEGIQYWLGYLFIQFYPQLFELFAGIKF